MKCIICGKISNGEEYRWIRLKGGENLCSEECLAKFNQSAFDMRLSLCSYEAKGRAIGRLVDSKQKQYGDSFHKCGSYLRLLYPDGIRPEQYDDLLTVVRDFDKSMRIATGNQGNEDAWADKCGYALLAMKDVVA